MLMGEIMHYLLNKKDFKESFKNYLCKYEDNKLLSSFLLNTNTTTINKLKNNMTISTKNVSYYSNDKAALLLLFKFADSDNLIFGRWFNYSNHIDKEHLEIMLFQTEIPIIITDLESTKPFTVYAPNDFSLGIKSHIKTHKNKYYKTQFSDDDFKSYINTLEKNINCLSKLWYSIDW